MICKKKEDKKKSILVAKKEKYLASSDKALVIEREQYKENIERIKDWHQGQKQFWNQKTPSDAGMLDGFF